MDILNTVLWWINIFVIVIVGIAFVFQILFMFIFYIPCKKYKDTTNYHKFTFIIRAHNEEDVIKDSVTSCFKVNYPKDKLEVVVFAHNCTDNTVKYAKECGARVIEINDLNPKHAKLAYAVKGGLEVLKKDGDDAHEFFLFLDADMQVKDDYVIQCNKAADQGVLLGRTFENSRNLTDNIISCSMGLWYLRDNFFACRMRSALNLGCVMNGGCAMLNAKVAYNWDAKSASEDLEFTINRLYKDHIKVEYIDDAIVYEDQPETMKDVYNRNTRMGNGINKVFWNNGTKLFKQFWKDLFKKDVKFSLKMAELDMFLNVYTIPASLIAEIWFPIYYIYCFIYTIFFAPMNVYYPFNIPLQSYSVWFFLVFAVTAVCLALFIPFFFQPAVSYLYTKDKLVIKNRKIMIVSIIFFPLFIIYNALCVMIGILTKPKWRKITRSKTKIEQ